MAVTIVGTPANDSGGGGFHSFSITIPADAEAVIFICTGVWPAGSDTDVDQLNWDDDASDVDFTQIVSNTDGTTPYDVYAYYMLSTHANWPGSGTHTLYWTPNGTVSEGGTGFAFCVDGIDSSDPIGDTEALKQGDTDHTASLTGVSAGDLVIAVIGDYTGRTIGIGTGQTSIYNGTQASVVSDVSYEDGEGSPSTTTSSNAYTGRIYFAVNAVGAAGLSIPVAMHHYAMMRNQ